MAWIRWAAPSRFRFFRSSLAGMADASAGGFGLQERPRTRLGRSAAFPRRTGNM